MATEADQQRVAQAILALPMRLRQVFVRATVMRMPVDVIAADLRLSRRQVERRMVRALVPCRGRLAS